MATNTATRPRKSSEPSDARPPSSAGTARQPTAATLATRAVASSFTPTVNAGPSREGAGGGASATPLLRATGRRRGGLLEQVVDVGVLLVAAPRGRLDLHLVEVDGLLLFEEHGDRLREEDDDDDERQLQQHPRNGAEIDVAGHHLLRQRAALEQRVGDAAQVEQREAEGRVHEARSEE